MFAQIMNIDKKLLVPLAMLAAISVGGAYAFLSLSVTTTLHIGEPLSIVTIAGSDDLAGLTCSSSGPLTATCGVDLSAGAIGGITVTIKNSGPQALVAAPAGSSDNTDVGLVVPDPATLSAGVSVDFTYRVAISPSAVPSTATLTLSFSR